MTSEDKSVVSYEDLAHLETDFEEAEVICLRHSVQVTQDLYTRRTALTARIPNFWPLVVEQAPPDIDEYILPSDSACLVSALKSLVVTHFELDEDPNGGDPRSIELRFEFDDNKWFSNQVLTKRFWCRRAKDGWAGLVSEPVGIQWKSEEVDLTGGLLGMAQAVWEAEQRLRLKLKEGAPSDEEEKKSRADRARLKERLARTGLCGVSFFAWFGYVGRRVSAEESREATTKWEAERRRVKEGGTPAGGEEAAEKKDAAKESEDDDNDEGDIEIFPDGDTLAIAISEDLWPNAIKYFTQSQEQEEANSEDGFVSDDDDDDGVTDPTDQGDKPPNKKRKA